MIIRKKDNHKVTIILIDNLNCITSWKGSRINFKILKLDRMPSYSKTQDNFYSLNINP